MNLTSSVSKGIFVFTKKRSQQGKHGSKQKHAKDKLAVWKNEPWYQEYRRTWQSLEQQMKEMYKEMFSKLLCNVSSFLKKEMKLTSDIPTATILTGINIPDHAELFSALEQQLHKEVSPHVAVLSSRSCPRVRALLGCVLHQCQSSSQLNTSMNLDDEDSDGDDVVQQHKKIQCTFDTLAQWYENQHHDATDRPPIAVVLTDFESFIPQVLEDFIYIARQYQDKVPLVLVLGVATTESAVLSSLPHRVMSSLRMEVFLTQNSNTLLHQLISKVILSQDCQFRVGGKVFRMLTDNFLFYDFSVQSFMQKFKLCMLEHFSGRLADVVSAIVKNKVVCLNTEALNSIRKLPSCRVLVEAQSIENRTLLLRDDDYLKHEVVNHVEKFKQHFSLFLVGLSCLHEITSCLPGVPMGKNIGDIYFRAVSTQVWLTEDYVECKKLWGLMAKTQLESHLKNIIHILNDAAGGKEDDVLMYWGSRLRAARKKLQNLDKENDECPSPSKKGRMQELAPNLKRAQLHEHLREMARSAPLNRFEKLRDEVLLTLEEMLTVDKKTSHCMLYPPGLLPLHELMMFDDLPAVKNQLIGNSRVALTTALSNPHVYLKCGCCELAESGEILPNMPDISIVYKLHLESGKHINLYDWLQSFHCVVNTKEDGGDLEDVDLTTQARFTQAVAELQFLGFIKSTTRKADHVMRLTWGIN